MYLKWICTEVGQNGCTISVHIILCTEMVCNEMDMYRTGPTPVALEVRISGGILNVDLQNKINGMVRYRQVYNTHTRAHTHTQLGS